MSVWSIVLSCWILASLPLGVLLGKLAHANGRPAPALATDDVIVDVDTFLERLFAA